MRRASVVIVAAAALAASGTVTAARSDRTVFANGVWSGTGHIEGGYIGSLAIAGAGPVSFHMNVCNGRALTGTLTFTEHVVGRINGGARFTGEVHGTLHIRDTADDPIHLRGPVSITATYRGITTSTRYTGSGKIEGHGTASRMTGDLAIAAAAAQASAGQETNVTAPYVARRTRTLPCR